MLTAGMFAFFAISGRPLLSLWRAFLAASATGLVMFLYSLAWLIAFELRLLCFRHIDSRVHLQRDERILAAELATVAGPLFPRGGALYLTTARLVFVSLRRKFPTIALPLEKDVRCDLAPRSLQALFQGGLRSRLRIQRRGEEEYFLIVWKPRQWVQLLRERLAQASSPGEGGR